MLNESKVKNAAYFYASEEAALYDETVRMTDRAYDIVHEVTARVLSRAVNKGCDDENEVRQVSILDVGCGTGAEAMRALFEIPNSRILCVDVSGEMLERFRDKVRRAFGDETAKDRLVLVQTDFREANWLCCALDKWQERNACMTFNAALSVYALHHLDSATKLNVYRAIAGLLKPDSVFVNADLYTFTLSWLSRLASEQTEAWIEHQFDEAAFGQEWHAAQLGPHLEYLRTAWLKHIREENMPLPIEDSHWDLNYHQKLIHCEQGLLRQAGFATFEVPMRLYQSAVLVAVK